jgi:plasmid stabilization system protein ParE
MKYAVEWLPSAEQELASLWNHAADRKAVTAAANALDADLARDPFSLGESRGERTRIAFYTPLAVLFDVDAASNTVTVWDLWRWPG